MYCLFLPPAVAGIGWQLPHFSCQAEFSLSRGTRLPWQQYPAPMKCKSWLVNRIAGSCRTIFYHFLKAPRTLRCALRSTTKSEHTEVSCETNATWTQSTSRQSLDFHLNLHWAQVLSPFQSVHTRSLRFFFGHETIGFTWKLPDFHSEKVSRTHRDSFRHLKCQKIAETTKSSCLQKGDAISELREE